MGCALVHTVSLRRLLTAKGASEPCPGVRGRVIHARGERLLCLALATRGRGIMLALTYVASAGRVTTRPAGAKAVATAAGGATTCPGAALESAVTGGAHDTDVRTADATRNVMPVGSP